MNDNARFPFKSQDPNLSLGATFHARRLVIGHLDQRIVLPRAEESCPGPCYSGNRATSLRPAIDTGLGENSRGLGRKVCLEIVGYRYPFESFIGSSLSGWGLDSVFLSTCAGQFGLGCSEW